MIDPDSHVILWRNCYGDTYANDGRGNNELVYRNEKRGATIINRKKFDAAVRDNNPPLESWPAFIGGLVIGASCAFVLSAIIGGFAWLVA